MKQQWWMSPSNEPVETQTAAFAALLRWRVSMWNDIVCQLCVSSKLHVSVSSGEGLVPEQENEVETCERRPAGGSSSTERTGEREKRDLITVGVFRDGGTAAFSEFAKDHRGRQSGQRPQRRLWPNMDQSTKTVVNNRVQRDPLQIQNTVDCWGLLPTIREQSAQRAWLWSE